MNKSTIFLLCSNFVPSIFEDSRLKTEKRNLDLMFERFTKLTVFVGISFLVFLMAIYIAGARINTTKSIPVGLYWTSSKPVEKGAYVMFCPPKNEVFDEAKERGYIDSGFCPGGYGYMMKKILAAKNDAISVTDKWVVVNNELLVLSEPINADMHGRPLPYYRIDHKILSSDEMMMMSDVSALSFDSRYFGPIHRSQIKSVIIPVVTW